MVAARVLATAAAVAALVWLMLDSRVVTPDRAPAMTSVSLGGLALLFGVGAWAMTVGGERSKSPLLAGLSLGLGAYALARILFS